MRPETRRWDRRALTLAGSGSAYFVFIVLLHGSLGPIVTAAAIVPVGLTGGLYGRRAGVIAGLLNLPLSFTLLVLQGATLSAMNGTWFGYLIVAVAGLGTGQFHALNQRVAAAKAAVERQAEWFRALVEHGGDVIAVIDSDGRFRYVSPSAERVFGYAPAELIGKKAAKYAWPSRDPRNASARAAPLQGANGTIHVFRVRHRDGSMRVIEATVTDHRSTAGVHGLVLNARDVTEKKAVEEFLRFHAQALDAVGEAATVTDAEGRILLWNDAAHRLYGWQAYEVIGRDLLEVNRPVESEGLREHVSALFRAGERYAGEVKVRRKDGKVLALHVNEAPIIDENRNLIGVVGISYDLSERRAQEDAAREARERAFEVFRLRELNRQRTQFLNNAAHQLRTPLTPLTLQADLLAAGILGPLTPKQEAAAKLIHRNVEWLTQIVQELVTAAELQKAPMPLNRHIIDLSHEVADAARVHAAAAKQKGIHLDILADQEASVYGDPLTLQRVVGYLVDNAMKLTPAGGRIDVSCRTNDGEAIVAVRDTGRGLTQDQIARLFEPFEQAVDPETLTRAGSGLGLFLARRFVEAHGGRIWCTSDGLGKGSTFAFAIPLSRRAPAAAQDDPMHATAA